MFKDKLINLIFYFSMKKILFTLLLFLSFGMMTKAQDFRVGATAGYNLSSPSGYNSGSGFHVGLKGELGLPQVTKGLYLDFGLMLSSYGWKSPGYYYSDNYTSSSVEAMDNNTLDYKLSPYYLNIPVHIGYKFSVGRNVNLFFNAGPYFNIGLFGKSKITLTDNNGISLTKNVSDNVFSDKVLNRFDWGLGVRAGAEIARHVQLSVGYDWGMKNVNKIGADSKNRTFTASFAYLF